MYDNKRIKVDDLSMYVANNMSRCDHYNQVSTLFIYIKVLTNRNDKFVSPVADYSDVKRCINARKLVMCLPRKYFYTGEITRTQVRDRVASLEFIVENIAQIHKCYKEIDFMVYDEQSTAKSVVYQELFLRHVHRLRMVYLNRCMFRMADKQTFVDLFESPLVICDELQRFEHIHCVKVKNVELNFNHFTNEIDDELIPELQMLHAYIRSKSSYVTSIIHSNHWIYGDTRALLWLVLQRSASAVESIVYSSEKHKLENTNLYFYLSNIDTDLTLDTQIKFKNYSLYMLTR